MVEINIVYMGQLRCQATHKPSSITLTTDAPVDNMGKGQSFSPTDLVATALGTCMLTIMGIVAQRHNIDIGAVTVKVTKEMVALPVRRIGRLGVTITVPAAINPEDRKRFEQAVLTCPVHKSMHPDIEMPIEFVWTGQSL